MTPRAVTIAVRTLMVHQGIRKRRRLPLSGRLEGSCEFTVEPRKDGRCSSPSSPVLSEADRTPGAPSGAEGEARAASRPRDAGERAARALFRPSLLNCPPRCPRKLLLLNVQNPLLSFCLNSHALLAKYAFSKCVVGKDDHEDGLSYVRPVNSFARLPPCFRDARCDGGPGTVPVRRAYHFRLFVRRARPAGVALPTRFFLAVVVCCA